MYTSPNRPGNVAFIEIVTGGGVFDTVTKYSHPQFRLPAQLTDQELADLRAAGLAMFEGLGCRGLARVDFFVVDSQPVLNEVNTMPGFTPFSMFPQLWRSEGLSYPELITELLELALERPVGLR